MAETHIFDSYALLKVFQKEEGYRRSSGFSGTCRRPAGAPL
jgi:hypothetical protein